MGNSERQPLVLLHCGWPRDQKLVQRLLSALGADGRPLDRVANLGQLVAEGRLDLVLADSSGGHGPLGELLRFR
jgi:hypothetical protein